MNVKPNDIARIISNDNRDRLCRVLERTYLPDVGLGPTWYVEALQTLRVWSNTTALGVLRDVLPGTRCIFLDKNLRPLHDGDGVDETLREREVVA